MKKLPKVKLVQASDEEKEALAQWLQERDIERVLASEDETRLSLAAEKASRVSDPIESGQIRLFSPFCTATATRLFYVAVIRRASHGWLIAPLSRYGTPATPGEWQTQRETTHLRVFCAWNAREISDSLLSRSWLVDTLTEDEQQSIVRLLALLADDFPLPAELSRRTGPPLRHPLDPRHEYLEEEADSFHSIQHETLTYPTRKPPEDLPLAAEDRDEYRTDDDPDKSSEDLSSQD